jgi:hypothetical protein
MSRDIKNHFFTVHRCTSLIHHHVGYNIINYSFKATTWRKWISCLILNLTRTLSRMLYLYTWLLEPFQARRFHLHCIRFLPSQTSSPAFPVA